MKDVFSGFGLAIYEDNSMDITNLGGNNIIAILKEDESLEPLFISCHSDTVAPGKDIILEVKDGIVRSLTDTIFGADDKAGITVMIEVIRALTQNNVNFPTLELVIHQEK